MAASRFDPRVGKIDEAGGNCLRFTGACAEWFAGHARRAVDHRPGCGEQSLPRRLPRAAKCCARLKSRPTNTAACVRWRGALDRLHLQPGNRALQRDYGQSAGASLHAGRGRNFQWPAIQRAARVRWRRSPAEPAAPPAAAAQVGGFQAGEVLGSKTLGAHGQEWKDGKFMVRRSSLARGLSGAAKNVDRGSEISAAGPRRRESITNSDLYDWEKVTRLLAEQAPDWVPGTEPYAPLGGVSPLSRCRRGGASRHGPLLRDRLPSKWWNP